MVYNKTDSKLNKFINSLRKLAFNHKWLKFSENHKRAIIEAQKTLKAEKKLIVCLKYNSINM